MGEHKFNVGDKVKVICNNNYGKWELRDSDTEINNVGTVIVVEEGKLSVLVESEKWINSWWFDDNELELVPEKPAVTPKSLLHINDLVLTAEGLWYIYTNFKVVGTKDVLGLTSYNATDNWWEVSEYNDNLDDAEGDCPESSIMQIARVDNFLDIIEGISSGSYPTQWEGFHIIWQRLTRESAEEQMKTLEQTIDSTQDSIRELEKQLVSKRQELKAIKEATENL